MIPGWGKGFEGMKLARRAEKALEVAKGATKTSGWVKRSVFNSFMPLWVTSLLLCRCE